MNIQKNEGMWDRFVRLFIGEALLIGAFFWWSGIESLLAYIVGIFLALTALSGFCWVYDFWGYSTLNKAREEYDQSMLKTLIIILVCILLLGMFTSHFITKNNFIKEFNAINEDYKQTLLSASLENREESIANYENLGSTFESFYEKYYSYRPYVLKGDFAFDDDLAFFKESLTGVYNKVNYGNLSAAYIELGSLKSRFADMLKRNSLLKLQVSVIELNDVIELILNSAREKNIIEVEKNYQLADAKLKIIEAKSNNDATVQILRTKLDAIEDYAKRNKVDMLAAKANDLQSSYFNVYMKLG